MTIARIAPADRWARLRGYGLEFLVFGLKHACACLFAGGMLGAILVTYWFYPAEAPLPRYDFLVLVALGLQAALLLLRLERLEEAAVILIYHAVGTVMEIFKTAQGSWTYPEDSILRIGGVPLFSGFMYACVGSYMARSMRLFDVRFHLYPPVWTTWVLALGAYANFFTHHYGPDLRWGLFALSILVFGRTSFSFTAHRVTRRMPMLLGFLLVALFIWIAENLSTFAAVWVYPSQRDGWTMVSLNKMGSWYLLMILSFVLVSAVHRPRVAR